MPSCQARRICSRTVIHAVLETSRRPRSGPDGVRSRCPSPWAPRTRRAVGSSVAWTSARSPPVGIDTGQASTLAGEGAPCLDRHAGDYCCKGHCGYHVHYCYHLKQRQQDGLQVTQVEINLTPKSLPVRTVEQAPTIRLSRTRSSPSPAPAILLVFSRTMLPFRRLPYAGLLACSGGESVNPAAEGVPMTRPHPKVLGSGVGACVPRCSQRQGFRVQLH